MDETGETPPWARDIERLNLAWLMLVRSALIADGPLAETHFGIHDPALARTLAELSLDQVLALSRLLGPAPIVRLDDRAGLRLLLDQVTSAGPIENTSLPRLALASSARRPFPR